MLRRASTTSWIDGALSWSTQLSDLRVSPNGAAAETTQRLARELKVACLFQDRTLIKDTDIVNHLPFQRMLVADAGLQDLVRSGTLVLNLRDTAECYSALNETIATARAFPQRYDVAAELLPLVDRFIREHDVLLAENASLKDQDPFRENLEVILTGKRISDSVRARIQEAMVYADRQGLPGPLRFGQMYDRFRGKDLAPESETVQWCRAAHILAIPRYLGLPLSFANDDLSPTMVATIMRHGDTHLPDPTQWMELYPKRILTDQTLDALPFSGIGKLRSIGDEVNYFTALRQVHGTIGSEAFGAAYPAFLEALQLYLEGIGSMARVDLCDWQRAWSEKELVGKEDRGEALGWALPTVFVTAVAGLITFSLVPEAAMSAPVAAAAGAIAAGVDKVRRVRKANTPSPLRRLLNGTSVHAPFRRPTPK